MLDPAVSADPNQLVQLDASNPGLGSSVQSDEGRKLLFGLEGQALGALMEELGEPVWRGAQLAEALYRQRVADLNEITTLSKSLRGRLAAEGWQVGRPRIAQVFHSSDLTERYLVECEGGETAGRQTVEAVWMPDGDDGEAGDGSDSAAPQSLEMPKSNTNLAAPVPALSPPKGLASETSEFSKPDRPEWN